MLPPVDHLSIACPSCHAAAWQPCAEAATGLRVPTHYSRKFVAEDLANRNDPNLELRISPLLDYKPAPAPAPKPPF